MDTTRYSEFKLGKNVYKLVMTIRATKEIVRRYNGLENLGEKLSNSSFIDGMTDTIWLITLLANQGIAIDNLEDGGKRPLLKEEDVEILLTPADFINAKGAINEAMLRGSNRYVEEETDEVKN